METLPEMTPAAADRNENVSVLSDVELPVSIRFGQTEMTLADIIKLGIGSVIELNSSIDAPVDLVVNGRSLARGEVVSVDGFYGIRITEVHISDRLPVSQ